MQPLVDVAHPVAALGVGAGDAGGKVCQAGLLVHAHAVVLHGDDQVLPLPEGGDAQAAGLVRLFKDAVDDGVLDDGLQDDFDDGALLHPRLHIPFGAHPVLKAHVLYLHIEPGVLEFVRQGDDLFAPAQRKTVEPGQGVHHAAYFRHIVGDGGAVDEVQGIVEEVGVDLGLQGLQLQGFYLLALFQLFVHQGVNAAHHVAEAAHQLADLVPALGRHPGGHVPQLHGVHGVVEQIEPPGDGLAEAVGQEVGRRRQQHHNRQHFHAQLAAGAEDVVLRQGGGQGPAAVLQDHRLDAAGPPGGVRLHPPGGIRRKRAAELGRPLGGGGAEHLAAVQKQHRAVLGDGAAAHRRVHPVGGDVHPQDGQGLLHVVGVVDEAHEGVPVLFALRLVGKGGGAEPAHGAAALEGGKPGAVPHRVQRDDVGGVGVEVVVAHIQPHPVHPGHGAQVGEGGGDAVPVLQALDVAGAGGVAGRQSVEGGVHGEDVRHLGQPAQQVLHGGVGVLKGLLGGGVGLLLDDGVDPVEGIEGEQPQRQHQKQKKDTQQFAPQAHVQQQAAPEGAQFILHGSKGSPGKGGAECPLPW